MAKETKFIGLVPASVLSVTEDTPVADCIKLMRDRNIGALVVLDERTGLLLVGIITERDIIKNFEMITKDRKMPVKRVMTTEVITLPVGQLHRAADLMLVHGFRHIVFTFNGKKDHNRVAGVASIRDFMHEYVRGAGMRLSPLACNANTVALITDSEDSRNLFKGLFQKISQVKLETNSIADYSIVEHSDLSGLKSMGELDVLFIDLDHAPVAQWTSLLRSLLTRAKRPKTVAVLFNPVAYEKKTLNALLQLSKSNAFSIIEKPLNLSAILSMMRNPSER